MPTSGKPVAWAVPSTFFGVLPTVSMMSISPQAGQLTSSMLVPIIQNAGHMPCPSGTLMLASSRPYACANLPLVVMRPEVMSQVP